MDIVCFELPIDRLWPEIPGSLIWQVTILGNALLISNYCLLQEFDFGARYPGW